MSDAFVYFIQAGPSGPIKIGFSDQRSVLSRVSNLQCAAFEQLSLLGCVPALPYGRRAEQMLHERFAAHRIRGEWFRPDESLLAYIAAKATRPERMVSMDRRGHNWRWHDLLGGDLDPRSMGAKPCKKCLALEASFGGGPGSHVCQCPITPCRSTVSCLTPIVCESEGGIGRHVCMACCSCEWPFEKRQDESYWGEGSDVAVPA